MSNFSIICNRSIFYFCQLGLHSFNQLVSFHAVYVRRICSYTRYSLRHINIKCYLLLESRCNFVLIFVLGKNLTFCELQREINRARSEDFIPRCKEDGEFEAVQCQRAFGECWCVDEAGMEIPDSRTLGMPHCNRHEGKGYLPISLGTRSRNLSF